MKRHALKIPISGPLLAWLRAEAERRDCSMAQVVRDLVAAAMEADAEAR